MTVMNKITNQQKHEIILAMTGIPMENYKRIMGFAKVSYNLCALKGKITKIPMDHICLTSLQTY